MGRAARLVGPALAVLLSAGCGGPATALSTVQRPGGPGPIPSPTTPEPSRLVVAPTATKNVAPGDPVRAELVNGTLESVTLTGPDHKAIAGAFDAERQVWQATGRLTFDRSYRLVVSGVGADGQRHQVTRAFHTARYRLLTMPYLRANREKGLHGGTFGVGQPIVVQFDEPIANRKAAQRLMSVTTQPQVVGEWRWMDDREAHWRPRDYWPSGTKVTVTVDIAGRHLGNGIYGQQSRSATFTIGQSKIAIADAKTHRMKVYIDGVLVTRVNGKDVSLGIPVSLGKNSGERAPNGAWIDFRTASGPHVVTTKHESYRMTSASYGITDPRSPNYYDETILKTVRISGSGEFVHLADWNIPQHGRENTSHGCINVAPTYIHWFYNTFGAGDIVDVTNTGRQLELRDGWGDWTLTWAEWVKGSAL